MSVGAREWKMEINLDSCERSMLNHVVTMSFNLLCFQIFISRFSWNLLACHMRFFDNSALHRAFW